MENSILPYEFSGMLSPMEKLLEWDDVEGVFRQMYGPDDLSHVANATVPSIANEANHTTEENGEQEVCSKPFAVANGMWTA